MTECLGVSKNLYPWEAADQCVAPTAAKPAAKRAEKKPPVRITGAEAKNEPWTKAMSEGAIAGLKLPAKTALALSQLACSSSESKVLPDCTVSFMDPDGVTRSNLMARANMYISGGKPMFHVELPIPADYGIANIPELVNGGTMEITLYVDNSLMGIGSQGELIEMSAEDTPLASCTATNKTNCTPFRGTAGMVPIEVIKVIDLPEGGKLEDYAVGGKCLKQIDGQLLAAWTPMNVMVTQANGTILKPVSEYLDPFDNVTKKVVEVLVGDSSDVDNPPVKKYYQVTDAGVLTTTEVNVQNEADLKPAFSLYRVDAEGKYAEEYEDGSPKADPTIADLKLAIVANEGVTLQDIIFGNAEVGQLGIFDVLDIKTIAVTAKVVAANLLPVLPDVPADSPVNGDGEQTLTSGAKVEEKANASTYTLDRSFYSSGDFSYMLVIDAEQYLDPDQPFSFANIEFGYSGAFDATVRLNQVPGNVCDDSANGGQ